MHSKARKSSLKMKPEANFLVQEAQAKMEVDTAYLIGEMMRELRVSKAGSIDRLNGRSIHELVESSLVSDWELFAVKTTIGVFKPERIRARLEKRMRECLEQEVVLGYSDLCLSMLNFSISLPAHLMSTRPTLRVVKG